MSLKNKAISTALCAIVATAGFFANHTSTVHAEDLATAGTAGMSLEQMQQLIVKLQEQITYIIQLLLQQQKPVCGNGACETAKGETAAGCAQDCNITACAKENETIDTSGKKCCTGLIAQSACGNQGSGAETCLADSWKCVRPSECKTIANLGGTLNYAPSIIGFNGKLYVAGTGSDNALWIYEYSPTNSAENKVWYSQGGVLKSGTRISAISSSATSILTFQGIGSDSQLWSKKYSTTAGWADWVLTSTYSTDSAAEFVAGPYETKLSASTADPTYGITYKAVINNDKSASIIACTNSSACAKEGENIYLWQPQIYGSSGTPATAPRVCCAGLTAYGGANEKVIDGKCIRNQYAVMNTTQTCIKCGDGVCNSSAGENVCSCSRDCSGTGTCVTEGNTASSADNQFTGCCANLQQNWVNVGPTTPKYNCTKCGDGKCDFGENNKNCAKDCFCGDGKCDPYETDTSCSQDCASTCKKIGESVNSMSAQCCSGLTIATNCVRLASTGNCEPITGCSGGTCINCGDGICSAGENKCNCAKDCDPTLTEYSKVFSATFTELTKLHGNCTANKAVSDACSAAINRYCAAKGYVTGFGAVEHYGDNLQLVCLTKDAVTTMNVSFDELAKQHRGCTESYAVSDSCYAAINRYCSAKGYASGFGAVEHSNGNATIACVNTSAASKTSVAYTNLTAIHSNCTENAAVSDSCYAAINRYCSAKGYASGFGAVEHSNGNARIACVKASNKPLANTIQPISTTTAGYSGGNTAIIGSNYGTNSTGNATTLGSGTAGTKYHVGSTGSTPITTGVGFYAGSGTGSATTLGSGTAGTGYAATSNSGSSASTSVPNANVEDIAWEASVGNNSYSNQANGSGNLNSDFINNTTYWNPYTNSSYTGSVGSTGGSYGGWAPGI